MPQLADDVVGMAKIWNDGFEKLKTRRVEVPGSQLPEIAEAFEHFKRGREYQSDIVTSIRGQQIIDGEEWTPHQYLPQPSSIAAQAEKFEEQVVLSLYQATATLLPLPDEALLNFGEAWNELPTVPLDDEGEITKYFQVQNGKSIGEKNYRDGWCPYISSGDATNSIIRLIEPEADEVFENGGITVTAFGQAYLQPWPFMARGNGGSSVRVLIPKWRMSVNELIWFSAQINLQKWRFFYGRMAIKSRLQKLVVRTPREHLSDEEDSLGARLISLRDHLLNLSKITL